MESLSLYSVVRTVGMLTDVEFSVALNTNKQNVIANGDRLSLTVQAPGSFAPSTALSDCKTVRQISVTHLQYIGSLSISSCTITANVVDVVFAVSGTPDLGFASVFVSGFTNPYSTTPIPSNTASLFSQAGVLKEYFQTGLMTDFSPDLMKDGSIVPGNQIIGKSGSTITVNFTPKNLLKTDGKIQMQFPYWYKPTHMVSTITSPTCTGTVVLKSSLQCNYFQSNQTLMISNILNSNQVGGTPMAFTVTEITNPYSAKAVDGFTLSTLDSDYGFIDSITTMTFGVSDWGTIISAGISRQDKNTTVGKESALIASFTVPYPVDANCILRIDFPSEMPVTSALVEIKGTTLFTTTTSLVFKIFKDDNYIQVTGCTQSFDKFQSVQLYLSYIVNPSYVKQTSTFKYSLYKQQDSVLYKIAQATAGITMGTDQMTTGSVTSFKLTAVDSNYIQNWTKYAIEIVAQHNIPTSSEIQIIFPSSITYPDTASCTVVPLVPSGGFDSLSFCSIATNVLTLRDPFGSGSYTAGDTLKFQINTLGQNPQVSKDSGSFQVSTYARVSSVSYKIDIGTFTNVFTPSPFTLDATMIPSSDETYYSPAIYTATITPNKQIPLNGLIRVVFPPEVTLISSSFSSIKLVKDGVSQTLSDYEFIQTEPLTVQISDAFMTGGYSATGQPFTIAFEGIRNPRTTALTDSFSIYTTDDQGNPIEGITTDVTVKMKTLNNLQDFTLTPLNLVNGQVSIGYTFSITTNAVLLNNDYMVVTWPVNGFALAPSPSCSNSQNVVSVTCSNIGNNIMKVRFISFLVTPVPSATVISFRVNGVTNPPSTTPTDPFTQLIISDSADNQISQGGTATVATTTPATVITSSLSQGSQVTSFATDYTISYTTINRMASGSAFYITYPITVSLPSALITCSITFNSVNYLMTCSVDTSSRVIKMFGNSISTGLNSAVASGNSLKLTFGPVTNPSMQFQDMGTFTLISYTTSSFTYTHDQIASGLIPTLECDFPCKTCLSSQSTQCTSCYLDQSNVNLKYLSGNKCLAECPAGTYPDTNKICQPCNSKCATCIDSTSCAACNSLGQYPLFYNDFCYAACPQATYKSGTLCQDCNSNCNTCSLTATNCTSCLSTGTTPILSQTHTCVVTCDPGYVIINGACVKCNSPCSTCIVDANTCTTCATGYLHGTKCVATCPSGFVQQGSKCVGCDPNCSQCSSTDTSKCITCKTPYLLLNNTCYIKCPYGYEKDDFGLSCRIIPVTPPIVIIDNTTNVTIIVNGTNGTIGTNTTIIQTEYIKVGYNFELIYFPHLIAATITTLVSVGGYFKDRRSAVISNILVFWGSIQWISYGVQTVLAFLIADWKYGVISALSFGFYLLLNIGFYLFYVCKLKHDEEFTYWRQNHKRSSTAISVLAMIFSFHIFKLFYSHFYGLDCFKASFAKPTSLQKAMIIFTILQFLLCYVPIVVVDIVGLSTLFWKTQLYITMIETLVMIFIGLILCTVEFCQLKKLFGADGGYKQVAADSIMNASIPADDALAAERKLREDMLRSMINKIKGNRDILLNNRFDDLLDQAGKRKCKSMISFGSVIEEDPREIMSDELLPKVKKRYEEPFSFESVSQEDNVYAESKPANPLGKIGKEYCDADIQTIAPRGVPKNGGILQMKEDQDEYVKKKSKKNRQRGRKNQYYTQIDAEDEEVESVNNELNETELDIIKEEEEETRQTNEEEKLQQDGDKSRQVEEERIKNEKLQQIKDEQEMKEREEQVQREKDEEMRKQKEQQEQEEQETKQQEYAQERERMEKQEKERIKQEELNQLEEIKAKLELEERVLQKLEEEKQRIEKEETELRAREEQEAKRLEEEIATRIQETQRNEQELLTNTGQQPISDISLGQEVSLSDENSQRSLRQEPDLQVPPDANKRTFNEHDILGNLDRDEKGKIQVLTNGNGDYIDKNGNRVNQRGYLLDPPTGDVLENTLQQKMFDQQDLDEHGEIPVPYCVEKYNFNPHDIRGNFDHDKQGRPIVKKNKKGDLIDKQGRLVNQKGWLVNEAGDIVNQNGRKKFDKMQLTSEGDLPKLYNYSGRRFDITDILGQFDKDSKGNPLLRMNHEGQNIDNKGRLVNDKGYLIDSNENIIDKNGKKLFEKRHLKNGEIPKIMPFTIFRIKSILGNFEMDPLGNPMLDTNSKGELIDRDGNIVNQRGYLIDQDGNVIDKHKRVMFDKDLLDQEGEIPKVFRTGLLKSDSDSSLSRLMSEIDRNQPPSHYDKSRLESQQLTIRNGISQVHSRKVSGDSSVDSMMEDTPSNYNLENQRYDQMNNRLYNQNFENIDQINEESNYEYEDVGGKKKRKRRKKKQIPHITQQPSDKDILMARAYGGVAKATHSRSKMQMKSSMRNIATPASIGVRDNTKEKLNRLTNSMSGYQHEQSANAQKLRDKFRDTGNYTQSNFMDHSHGASLIAVPDSREQKLKQKQMKDLKARKTQKANKLDGGAEFEKLFGRDIDEYLEADSDLDIRSFDQASQFSKGTSKSALQDGRIRGLESIYLQRLETSMKKPQGRTPLKVGSKQWAQPNKTQAKFRVMQDRFVDDPALMHEQAMSDNIRH